MILTLKEVIQENINPENFNFIKDQLIELYNQLSKCNNVSLNILLEFINADNTYVYINDRLRILGCITLLFERKLIHNGGVVCHIEDLVVHKNHRNKAIGSQLLEFALEEAKHKGCYKVILDCTSEIQSFYLKNGFENHNSNIQMAHYFQED